MIRSTFITHLCLLLLLVASACSKSAQNSANESPAASATPSLTEDKKVRSIDVVKAIPQPTAITAGSSAEAVVRLTIQNGYHINANPPTYPYLIATALEVTPASGVLVGKVTYPKPLDRKFVFAEKALAVYEGETELRATIKVDKTAKLGEQSLAARLRVQACDEAVCYPPGSIDLVIPVNIK